MRTRAVSIPILALLAACQTDGPAGLRSMTRDATLQQVIRLRPATPAPDEILTIESVVINRGTQPAELTSRICGLDTKGDLALTGSLMMCAGYSMQGTLPPGDSLTGFDARVVASAPGHYTLRVRHLLDPERWVVIPVDVR
jgi:hypothetical protein